MAAINYYNIPLLLCCCCLLLFPLGTYGSLDLASSTPNQRQFSLFSIVSFPNDQCVTMTDTTMRGTCYSLPDCEAKGGISDGNCAAGFGVCCMFVVSTCGGTVSQNCSYIQNPGFPSSFAITAATTCTYNIRPCTASICQMRLDFDSNVLAPPVTTTGLCTADTLTVTSPTGVSPPVICGSNTGQHMYVEQASSSSNTVMTFVMDGTTTATRTYKVKVSQIPCNVNYKAPEGCVKYFTGTSGITTSYNFGHMLQSQDFSTCIRQEQGTCGVQYTPTEGTTPAPFALDTLNAIAAAALAPTACILSYVTIPGAAAVPPKYCGGSLSDGGTTIAAASPAIPSVVTSTQSPFLFQTVATASDMLAAITGYSIMYSLVPC